MDFAEAELTFGTSDGDGNPAAGGVSSAAPGPGETGATGWAGYVPMFGNSAAGSADDAGFQDDGAVTVRFQIDGWVPDVRRGDYFWTPPSTSTLHCNAYTTPFLFGPNKGRRVANLKPNMWFGPVHDYHRNWVFLAVRVPVWWKFYPNGCSGESEDFVWKRDLLWVNVYNSQDQVSYAKKVPNWTVEEWRAQGWWGDFLDADA